MSTMIEPGRASLRSTLFDYLTRIRRLEAIPPPNAVFEIKLFADAAWPDTVSLVLAGDGRFILEIDRALEDYYLWDIQIFVTTVGTGLTTLQVRRVDDDTDLLSTPVTIDSGELSSCTAEDPYEIDTSVNRAIGCEQWALDVDTAATGSKGLGCILTLSIRQRGLA